MHIGDDFIDLDDPERIHDAMHESLRQCCIWLVLIALCIIGAVLLVLHPWTHH